MKPKHQKGFTLLEIMIVVAVVGILAAIAFPSYQEYTRKARRADCAGELVLLANAMERSFTLVGTYPANLAAANFPASCPIDGGTPSYNFNIALTNGGMGFVLRATPTGVQTVDKCGTLTLTHTGEQDVDGASGGMTKADCW